jgi:integrase
MSRLARAHLRTLAEWADEWASFSFITLKPGTAALYGGLLRSRILPTFGDLPLSDIDGLMVRHWIAAMNSEGLSPSRIRQAHILLSQIYSAAVECGLAKTNPCVGVRLPRVAPYEALFLAPHEVAQLADAVPTRYRSLILLLAYGGLRWGEAAALKRKRVDLETARIIVAETVTKVRGTLVWGETKSKRIRTIGAPAFLVEELRSHLATVSPAPDALVYETVRGHTLRVEAFRKAIWTPSLLRAGLPPTLRIHDLRHTCASILISRGVHPKAIQQHLGHASIDITMNRYGHLFPDHFQGVATQLQLAHDAGSLRERTEADGLRLRLPSRSPQRRAR